MSDNIHTNTAGQTPPCLQHQIEKTRYLKEVYFSDTSAKSVEDRLRRVILHDLAQFEPCSHGKRGSQGKMMKNDEYVLDK